MTDTGTQSNGVDVARRTSPTPFPWHLPFGQLMDSFWHTGHGGSGEPGAEITEADDQFVVEVDLPGVSRDDVTIDVTGRRLLVHATRSERERTGMLRHTTRTTGEIEFAVALPTPIDDGNVTASMTDGVLTIRLPKTDAARTTRVVID